MEKNLIQVSKKYQVLISESLRVMFKKMIFDLKLSKTILKNVKISQIPSSLDQNIFWDKETYQKAINSENT